MPEGHTLHRLAGQLSTAFAGQVVQVSSPQGRFADAVHVDGTRLLGAASEGKHLFLEFERDLFVHVHLGLIGKFDVHEGPPPAPVARSGCGSRRRRRTPTCGARPSATWSRVSGVTTSSGRSGPTR